jgi:hypothetical protein
MARGMGVGFIFDRDFGDDHRVSAVPISGFEDANVDEIACLKEQRANPLVASLFDCADRILPKHPGSRLSG